MSARVLLRPQAERDLIAIWYYIAQDNSAAADRVLDGIDVVRVLERHRSRARLLADDV